jgi:hypothetical protein
MNRVHWLALAAVVSASVMTSATSPAAADQGMQRPVAKAFASRHHTQHVGRRAIVRAHPPIRVAAMPGYAACSGPWCGREFVLMLGIGF